MQHAYHLLFYHNFFFWHGQKETVVFAMGCSLKLWWNKKSSMTILTILNFGISSHHQWSCWEAAEVLMLIARHTPKCSVSSVFFDSFKASDLFICSSGVCWTFLARWISVGEGDSLKKKHSLAPEKWCFKRYCVFSIVYVQLQKLSKSLKPSLAFWSCYGLLRCKQLQWFEYFEAGDQKTLSKTYNTTLERSCMACSTMMCMSMTYIGCHLKCLFFAGPMPVANMIPYVCLLFFERPPFP